MVIVRLHGLFAFAHLLVERVNLVAIASANLASADLNYPVCMFIRCCNVSINNIKH